MKKNYLFPHSSRVAGWILTGIFGLAGILFMAVGSLDFLGLPRGISEFTDEMIVIGLIVGLMLVGFSREKDEDEYIASIRGRSLISAVMINYCIVILQTLFIYNLAYLDAVFIDLFLVLIIYILIFRISMISFRHSGKSVEQDEKHD